MENHAPGVPESCLQHLRCPLCDRGACFYAGNCGTCWRCDGEFQVDLWHQIFRHKCPVKRYPLKKVVILHSRLTHSEIVRRLLDSLEETHFKFFYRIVKTLGKTKTIDFYYRAVEMMDNGALDTGRTSGGCFLRLLRDNNYRFK